MCYVLNGHIYIYVYIIFIACHGFTSSEYPYNSEIKSIHLIIGADILVENEKKKTEFNQLLLSLALCLCDFCHNLASKIKIFGHFLFVINSSACNYPMIIIPPLCLTYFSSLVLNSHWGWGSGTCFNGTMFSFFACLFVCQIHGQ